MTDDRRKPEEWPGATVHRVNLRPESHDAAELARVLAAWLGELHAAGRFVKHLVVSVGTRDGVPKGLRYNARAVLWPAPRRRDG
jgi:hypothetical protein